MQHALVEKIGYEPRSALPSEVRGAVREEDNAACARNRTGKGGRAGTCGATDAIASDSAVVCA